MSLSVRMHVRRVARLTDGHSNRRKHHIAMQTIFVAFYNFARKHERLGSKSPAMAAGLADKVWSIRELLENAATAD